VAALKKSSRTDVASSGHAFDARFVRVNFATRCARCARAHSWPMVGCAQKRARKKGRLAAPWIRTGSFANQPFDARAALRERLDLPSSPMPLPAVALLPVVLEPVVALEPVVELAAPAVPAPALVPAPVAALPLFDAGAVDVPALPGDGSAAPIWPAAVPGPMRPALSESAGEPAAAYAPATAADMQPATNAIMTFFIKTSRKE
jgi:hypothetical protein